jgi:hypothetical protein
MDDQDAYPRALAKDAQAGEDFITTTGGITGLGTGETTLCMGKMILISDGKNGETQHVAEVKPMGHLGDFRVKLKGTLANGYRVQDGAKAAGVKTQPWGIFVGGPKAKDNVVANNVCVGNAIGGILWQGSGTAIANNVGHVAAMDDEKSLEENVYPAVAAVKLPTPGFEDDTGWQLGPGAALDAPGHSGQRALKIVKAEDKGVADATSEFFLLKPNARYRLSAWVKSNATEGDTVVEPYLFLYSRDGKPVGGRTRPLRSLDSSPPKAEPLAWFKVSGEAQTGPSPVEAKIHCRLEGAVGEVWFDDLMLEELTWLP